jgi:immune inhibitor A
MYKSTKTIKMKKVNQKLLQDYDKIIKAAHETRDAERCLIAPHPDLKKKLDAEMKKLTAQANKGLLADKIKMGTNYNPVGYNDGLIYPGTMYPIGTTAAVARNAAADRAPLRGVVRVAVVLVDFSDKVMTATKAHFEELFFSLGALATGSVREYYREVTHGLVDIQGQVVGTYRMPRTMAQYAHGAAGTGAALPNARTMAKDAAVASNPAINFANYDNDGNGFVDAFVVVHAGTGGEQSGNPGDIWSHKWVLDGGEYTADGSTKIYAYLTVPEDCKVGVCAHELGHLLFGFPDLYDTDGSSEGIGNWCLMAGGSWNNNGNTPAHPSAWCKCQQGWVNQVNQTTNQNNVAIEDVKTGFNVHRLWKNGAASSEYFLVENRQKTLFDRFLPKEGLLIWHIDDAVASNTNEAHYKVGLMQADNLRDMELNHNRGDGGDVYPGTANNRNFNNSTSPSSKSYAGSNTCVAVNNISVPGSVMRADLKVKCVLVKPNKEFAKENIKEFLKEINPDKAFINDKSLISDKGLKADKALIADKNFISDKSLVNDKGVRGDKTWVEKPIAEKLNDKLNEKFAEKFNEKLGEKLGEGGGFGNFGGNAGNDTERRLSNLESQLGFIQPFIEQSLRPDLSQGALSEESDEDGTEE